jgi:hypothetical protein
VLIASGRNVSVPQLREALEVTSKPRKANADFRMQNAEVTATAIPSGDWRISGSIITDSGATVYDP